MPTNYQTLITEVKKTKQDNIKMAPMFKGTPGKEPDQMSLLELLGAAYAILKEQNVGTGNDAMKQWLSGVQVALDTIDSFSPVFPPESVFSADLVASSTSSLVISRTPLSSRIRLHRTITESMAPLVKDTFFVVPSASTLLSVVIILRSESKGISSKRLILPMIAS